MDDDSPFLADFLWPRDADDTSGHSTDNAAPSRADIRKYYREAAVSGTEKDPTSKCDPNQAYRNSREYRRGSPNRCRDPN
jgi:hypothetical protein